MYKQSTYVLALFLGTASATQLTNSFATGMNGDEDLGEDITMKGNKFHFAQGKDISETGMNYHVYELTDPEVTHPNYARSDLPHPHNGLDAKWNVQLDEQEQYNRFNRDISEKNIDEDVQDFANKHVERLAWPRSEAAFVPNGSKVTFPAADPVANPYSLHQRRRNGRDISEKNIDEEVQGMANTMVDRLNWPRSEEPFVPNGSQMTFPPSLYQRRRNGRDISEKNIDEEVQGMANTMVDRLNWPRSEEPFVPNGSQVTFPASLHQRNGRDISEKNIDEEVQGMANTMVDRLNWPRSEEPFVPNGSQMTFPPSLYQRRRNGRDISEKNIDEEVQGMANTMVDRLNWPRSEEPFVPNGSQVTFPAASLYQHHKNAQDIANKEVRPDVWVTVHKMVDPVAHWRGNKAPKSTYEDWWGEGPPPMQELEKPKCPEELEEPEHPMAKKLKKQAKKAKAKKEKEDAEMPGDIEEKKEEKKDDAKDEKKGDAKDAKDEKKDEKEEDSKDEKKEDAKEEKKEEKLHQHTPPKSSLIYDEQNNLWRTEY